MKKDEYTIFVELKRLPKNCADCPMFSLSEYRCHNERGDQGNCKLGYMKGADMRDFTGKSLYSGCRLLIDERVRFHGKMQ